MNRKDVLNALSYIASRWAMERILELENLARPLREERLSTTRLSPIVIETFAGCVDGIPTSYGREYTCPRCGNVFLCLNDGKDGVDGRDVWTRLTFTGVACDLKANEQRAEKEQTKE